MSLFKSFKNNFSLAIEAVILAVIVWFVISVTQYPSVQKTIEHIQLSQDITGSTAANNGLSIISCDIKEVTVDLLGSRTEVGNLNNENLIAYIDTDNVTTSGTKNLTIKIKSTSDINYEVKSVEPASVTVVFDKYDTQEYHIKPIIPNVSFAEGKAINPDEFSCEPDVVRITGPSAQLDKIAQCVAVSEKELTLDSSYVLSSDEIQLYTEDGAIIDQSLLKFNTTNFSINIPVRTQKTVKLGVSIVNAPSNFDQSCLNFNMSADTIVLAANNSQTEIPDTLEIGKIPLSSLDSGYTNTFTISNVLENTEYINVSNLETVTVSLDSEGLAKTDLVLDQSRITISNIPDSSYDYYVLTYRLPVSVIGPEEIINELTAEDIIADVNLLNASITSDQINNYPVTFSCTSYNNVWVITSAKVSIQRYKQSVETTTESTSESLGTL